MERGLDLDQTFDNLEISTTAFHFIYSLPVSELKKTQCQFQGGWI